MRLIKGDHIIETSAPEEQVNLKAQGYREVEAEPEPLAEVIETAVKTTKAINTKENPNA
ncbi:hypothetical protein [Micrococcus luteus]|uniref:hypothetical protein n=1 Tax=Micrococcus luteus TaxID=1270 RepID=UPI0029DD5F83|nr:hypothetical protein [Micrococcus luteus]